MTDYAEYFHPELEAILQEIARDPRAKMLRVPSSGALVYATRQPRVGVAAPGLTAAERELLTVHREELAERLKERCLIEFFRQPDAEIRLHKSVAAGKTLEIRDPEAWRRDTERILEAQLEEERTRVAKDVLQKCIEDDRGRPISITQIATAMMRVATREQGTVYVAIELIENGRPGDGIDLLEQGLSEGLSAEITSYSHEWLAVAKWRQDRFAESLESAFAASKASPARIAPALSSLAIAVRLGAWDEARRSASAIDELAASDESAIPWFTNPDRLQAFPDVQDQAARREASRLSESVGEATRRVLHAILG